MGSMSDPVKLWGWAPGVWAITSTPPQGDSAALLGLKKEIINANEGSGYLYKLGKTSILLRKGFKQ